MFDFTYGDLGTLIAGYFPGTKVVYGEDRPQAYPADAFGIADAYTGDIETVREEAVQAVHKLTVDLKNPTKISEVGATEADLEPLAHDAFHDVCTPGNPRQATQEDILAIYKSLM